MFTVHRFTALPALLAGLVLGNTASAAAAPIEVYLYDYAKVPPAELARAKQFVERLYAKSGVELRWIDPAHVLTSPTSLPLQLVLVASDMTAQKEGPHRHNGEVFGSANRDARRAYVFYSRVANHALVSSSNVTVLLAAVMAHELGHLLLPAGHSSRGLMRAQWSGRIVQLPDFEKPQQQAIANFVAGERVLPGIH